MITKYRNGMVMRDLIFMIILFTGIISLSVVVVGDFATTSENPNMSSELQSDEIGIDKLNETATDWEEIGQKLSGDQGIIALASGSLDATGTILLEAVTAPITFAGFLESITYSMIPGLSGDSIIVSIMKFIIIALIYALVVFTIITAFLQGGKI